MNRARSVCYGKLVQKGSLPRPDREVGGLLRVCQRLWCQGKSSKRWGLRTKDVATADLPIWEKDRCINRQS